MSAKEARAYAAWFHAVLPERVAILSRAVRSTPGFEQWERNRTPESLDVLGRWFGEQVEMVSRTDEELAVEQSKMILPIEVAKERPSDRTISVAIDVAMYFSQVVLKNVRGTSWSQVLRSKRSIDYGRPVITGFGKVSLNPVHLVLTMAYRAARGGEPNLGRLYDIWAAMADTNESPSMESIRTE